MFEKTLSHFFVCRLVDDCKCEQEKKKKRQFSASLKVVLEILNHDLGHSDFEVSATVIVNGQSECEQLRR